MAHFKKPLTSYFPRESLGWGNRPPNISPGTAFLTEVVEISDSVAHCSRCFTRNKDEAFTKHSRAAFQSVMASSFASLMSHFESFQRELFSESISTLDFIKVSDDATIAKALEKVGCSLSVLRLLAGRGDPREPGHVIADALTGWHDPQKVNRIFSTVFESYNLYSNDICEEIALMWQIRHSIVHTGGVITKEDAMKHPQLVGYGDRKLEFSDGFIVAIARRLHLILQATLDGLKAKVKTDFRTDLELEDVDGFIDDIFGCTSPRKSWFKPEKV